MGRTPLTCTFAVHIARSATLCPHGRQPADHGPARGGKRGARAAARTSGCDMGWKTTRDLEAFLTAASGFLRARAVENTVLITVAEGLRLRGLHAYGETSPRFGWWQDAGGTVAAAFLQTP